MNLQYSLGLFIISFSLILSGCTDDVITSQTSQEREEISVSASSQSDTSLESTGKYIINASNARAMERIAQAVEQEGGTISSTLDPINVLVAADLSTDAVESVANVSGVREIVDDLIIPLDDNVEVDQEEEAGAESYGSQEDPSSAHFYPRQWHLREATGANEAWDAGYFGSPDVLVSIIDSGLDYNHANLEGIVDLDRSISLLPAQDEALEQLFPGSHPVADLNRHGTHVGGIVSSNAENIAGVTSKTTLMGVKACRAGAGGLGSGCPRSAILEGIVYSADQGANIINLSLGGFFDKAGSEGFVATINRAITYANRKGTLIVAAAGNQSRDLDRLGSEFRTYCDAPNVVCVAGTGPTARETIDGPWTDINAFWDGSNFGRSTIDVAAPSGNTGNFVYSSCSSRSLRTTGCQASNRFVIGLRGTSMASPHVAGLAAMIMAEEGTDNIAVVRNRLHQTADKLGDSAQDKYYGGGLINIPAAMGLE